MINYILIQMEIQFGLFGVWDIILKRGFKVTFGGCNHNQTSQKTR